MTDPIQYLMLDSIRELNADAVSLSADMHSAEVGFLMAVIVFLTASIVFEVLCMRRFGGIRYRYEDILKLVMFVSGSLGLILGCVYLVAYDSLAILTAELEHAVSAYAEVYGPLPDGWV